MIGSGYYVITHLWDGNVFGASLIYALGVTTVIFGKHIDKIQTAQEKNIRTLSYTPSLRGGRAWHHLLRLTGILTRHEIPASHGSPYYQRRSRNSV